MRISYPSDTAPSTTVPGTTRSNHLSNCFSEKAEKKSSAMNIVVPNLSRKRGTFKLICLSVCPSICQSQKTLNWPISSEVLVIEHWYLACMILVTNPFNWYHVVILTFDLLQVKFVARRGTSGGNSSNLLVLLCVHWLSFFIYVK